MHAHRTHARISIARIVQRNDANQFTTAQIEHSILCCRTRTRTTFIRFEECDVKIKNTNETITRYSSLGGPIRVE